MRVRRRAEDLFWSWEAILEDITLKRGRFFDIFSQVAKVSFWLEGERRGEGFERVL